MRFSALIPVVLSAAAFILTFLCLFAGSKKGFMEDYAIVTVSTLLLVISTTAEKQILTLSPSSTHLASAKNSLIRQARIAQTVLSASSTISSMMSRARSTTRSTTLLRIWAFT